MDELRERYRKERESISASETRKETSTGSAEVSTQASTTTSSTESMAELRERYKREEISSTHVSSSTISASTVEETVEKQTAKVPLLAFHPDQGHTLETTGELSTKMKPGEVIKNFQDENWKDHGDSIEARLAEVKERYPNF